MQGRVGDRVTMAEVDGLCAWLRDYLGDRKAVVGISGGVDSSVVAALCVRALGAERVVAVRLPCGEDKDAEWTDMLLKHLGIGALRLHIEDPVKAMISEIKEAIFRDGAVAPINLSNVEVGNVHARMRMIAIYSIANHCAGIVVGTTNRSEFEIGYMTKYGDHGVDLEPLQEFLKGEVRALGRLLGLPEPLVDRVPTAGLWEGQTDEGEIGMSYDDLDRYLLGVRIANEHVRRLTGLMMAAEHKKRVPPSYKRTTA
jgi:NAD+ synthase